MMITTLAVSNLSVRAGRQLAVRGVSAEFRRGQFSAIIGPNGAGKSTLLRALMGLDAPAGGDVHLAGKPLADWTRRERASQLAYLAQGEALPAAAKVRDVVALGRGAGEWCWGILPPLAEGGGETRAIEQAMRRADVLPFAERRVGELSGGERQRVSLARALAAEPDFLLLDEPTNHLDIAMREWLEGFLMRYPGAMILVSHDRAFLDAVATQTAYVRDGEVEVYTGNYSKFRVQLEQDLEREMAQFKVQQKQIDALAKSAARMKIWGLGMAKLARRAHAMESRLQRMKDAAVDAPDPEEDVAEVNFDCLESATTVLEATHLSKSFAGRQLFRDVAVTVRKGERIAIVGKNGAGKTTFVRTLLGILGSDNAKSQVRVGARVKMGYYDQQLRGVTMENTVYDEARSWLTNDKETRNLLGAYLFPYDTQDKKISSLSGGERARLALLKLSLERNNLLVLDEPTNHLDMEMLESLEDALREFPGTLILVSHDRAFIENVADQIWLLEDGEFYAYPGKYSYYKQKHLPKTAGVAEVIKAVPQNKKSGPSLWHLKRKVEALELDISTLESELAQAHNVLENAAPDADFAALGNAVAALETKLLEKMTEWEETSARVAQAG